MNQRSLFPLPQALTPSPKRTEPLIWIRRLIVLKELQSGTERVREVEFHRGLNIICTAPTQKNAEKPAGHSVGKSLAVRLIRYCLGELSFCKNDERLAIGDAYPKGYVVAEFTVNAELWVVARPIGFAGSAAESWALQCASTENFIGRLAEARKFSEFQAAVNRAMEGVLAGLELIYERRPARWHDVLGWLARDQQCRYRFHNEWRDSEAESGTVQLKKEDASLIIRTVMGLLSSKERKLRSAHEVLNEQRRTLENDIKKLKTHLDFYESDLRAALKLPDDGRQGALFFEQAMQVAEWKMKELEQQIEKENRLFEADKKQDVAYERKLASEIMGNEQKLPELEAAKNEKEANYQTIMRASDDEFLATFDMDSGWCRLFQTKERALEMGCPGKGDIKLPGESDPRKEARLQALKEEIETDTKEIDQINRELTDLREKHDEVEARLSAMQQRHDVEMRSLYGQIGDCKRGIGFIKDFKEKHEGLERIEGLHLEKEKAIQDSLKELEIERSCVGKDLQLLNEAYDRVLKTIISPKAGGEIELEADSIRPRPYKNVGSKGEAMGTFASVLGFDVACLYAAVCGLGSHPLVLIHDSPREADMEEYLYHKLFRLFVEFEAQFDGQEPSFQYILTTTTRPPQEMMTKKWVPLELDANQSNHEGYFLKQEL